MTQAPKSGAERMRELRKRQREQKLADIRAIEAERGAEPVQAALPGVPAPVEREGGRPPDASNRDPEAWRQYFLTRYGSPLKAAGEAFSKSIRDLAAELHCTPLEAARFRLDAARFAAPYVHREQPRAVDVTSGGQPLVVAVAPSLAAALDAEDARRSGGRAVDATWTEEEA